MASKVFIWVPSHGGISGNAKADQAVYEGRDAGTTLVNKYCQ